jgi:hypothetical protein
LTTFLLQKWKNIQEKKSLKGAGSELWREKSEEAGPLPPGYQQRRGIELILFSKCFKGKGEFVWGFLLVEFLGFYLFSCCSLGIGMKDSFKAFAA